MDAQEPPKKPDLSPIGVLVHRLFDHEAIIIGEIAIRIGKITPASAHVTIQAPKTVKIKILRRPPIKQA